MTISYLRMTHKWFDIAIFCTYLQNNRKLNQTVHNPYIGIFMNFAGHLAYLILDKLYSKSSALCLHFGVMQRAIHCKL